MNNVNITCITNNMSISVILVSRTVETITVYMPSGIMMTLHLDHDHYTGEMDGLKFTSMG